MSWGYARFRALKVRACMRAQALAQPPDIGILLGKKSGPPIALVTQPPLACQFSKDKEIDLFSYQFILETGLEIEQINDKLIF